MRYREITLRTLKIKDTVICGRHFPSGFATVVVRGKERPKYPPSVFNNLPSSVIPTPPPKARPTKKTSASIRSIKDDELSQFLKTSKIEDFETLCANASHHGFPSAVVCYKVNNQLSTQSVDCFAESIPAFLIKIHVTMKFERYHASVQTFISTENRITVFHHWSQIEEAVGYLDSLPIDQKKTHGSNGATNCWKKSLRVGNTY